MSKVIRLPLPAAAGAALRLEFEVVDGASGAFRFGPQFEHVVDAFHQLLDARDGGMPDKHYLAALRKLAERAPDFIDLQAHIALYWHDRDQPKRALDAALGALAIANSRIPEGFDGRIEWHCLDNRPYLRAMHVALGAYIRAGRHREAVTLIELMLARNPDDNQGVRFQLGAELLRSGAADSALALLQKEAGDYAPNLYELALCYLLREDYVAAATALRRGFAANFYIAEILGGNPEPAPFAIYHRSCFDDPVTARDYVRTHGALWQSRAYLSAFVRWLFNQPLVLAERAALMESQEALAWERDPAARATWMEREQRHLAGIDDQLSRSIIVRRQYRHGGLIWPWLAMHQN